MIKFYSVISVFSLVCMLIIAPPAPDDLKRVKGEILVNELKNGGVGSILKLKTEQNFVIWLNVTGLSKRSNGLVRELEVGDTVEALYSDKFILKNRSRDVWFLKSNGQSLLCYQERKKLNLFYQGVFGVIALVSIFFAVFISFKRKR